MIKPNSRCILGVNLIKNYAFHVLVRYIYMNFLIFYFLTNVGTYMIKMFFPTVVLPSRKEVQDQVTKVYPGAKIVNYKVSDYDSGEPILQTRG